VRLEEYLIRLGEIWCQANDLAATTLGARLANDGKLFARLRAGGGVNTGRFQDFLSFFRDGGNWEGGRIPETAVALLDNLANIATDATASLDIARDNRIDGQPSTEKASADSSEGDGIEPARSAA